MRNVDCGMWIAECGLRNVDCGLRIAECGMEIAPEPSALWRPSKNPIFHAGKAAIILSILFILSKIRICRIPPAVRAGAQFGQCGSSALPFSVGSVAAVQTARKMELSVLTPFFSRKSFVFSRFCAGLHRGHQQRYNVQPCSLRRHKQCWQNNLVGS